LQWEKLESLPKWVALNENSEPCMKDSFDKIKGDPHGRCAGIVYLRHKTTDCQVDDSAASATHLCLHRSNVKQARVYMTAATESTKKYILQPSLSLARNCSEKQ